MNNIHEKDWASGCWSSHTGMNSFDDYYAMEAPPAKASPNTALPDSENEASTDQEAGVDPQAGK